MNEGTESELKRRYEEAFYFPARHCWESVRGRSIWIDLEVLQERLAGPIFSVKETGGCAYVYLRNDAYFSGVGCPVALRERLRQWHSELVDDIERFVPTSPSEAADLASMRRFASEIWTVVDEACDIEHIRWETVAG